MCLHYVGLVNGCDFLPPVASGVVKGVLCDATRFLARDDL